MGRLDGKVAIITGGAAGIGRATALLFASEGACVAIGDIDLDGANRTASDITSSGGEALALHTDVSVGDDCERLVHITLDRFGGVHVLHNNAYWARGGRTVVTLDEADWDRAIDVSLKGMYLMSRYAVPAMTSMGNGSIINMASAVGLMGTRGNPAYAAAKGAVISFTKSLAIDFGKQGIRANCIAPGSIATEANAERRKDPRWTSFLLEHTLLARTGVPEDIAYAALFLASDESSYVTGTTLVVDGGATSTPNWGSTPPSSTI